MTTATSSMPSRTADADRQYPAVVRLMGKHRALVKLPKGTPLYQPLTLAFVVNLSIDF